MALLCLCCFNKLYRLLHSPVFHFKITRITLNFLSLTYNRYGALTMVNMILNIRLKQHDVIDSRAQSQLLIRSLYSALWRVLNTATLVLYLVHNSAFRKWPQSWIRHTICWDIKAYSKPYLEKYFKNDYNRVFARAKRRTYLKSQFAYGQIR